MDRIILTGLQFWGYHGVLQEERVLGQPFIIDLELGLDLQRAGDTDRLDYTVNYAKVYDMTKHLVEETEFNLVETVAEKIAAALLAEFALREVKVRVNKPRAPVKGQIHNIAVEIVRRSNNHEV